MRAGFDAGALRRAVSDASSRKRVSTAFRTSGNGIDQLLGTKGRWLTETSFQPVSRSILEGIVTTTTLNFHCQQVDVEIEDNRGVRGRLRGDSTN